MSLINKLSLLAIMFSTINCYEQYIGNAKHPDFPEKCYSQQYKQPISIGEVFRPTNTGECHKITCRDDFVLRIDSCPRFQVGEDCSVISGDLTRPFPNCCAQLKCVDRYGNSEINPTHNEYNSDNFLY